MFFLRLFPREWLLAALTIALLHAGGLWLSLRHHSPAQTEQPAIPTLALVNSLANFNGPNASAQAVARPSVARQVSLPAPATVQTAPSSPSTVPQVANANPTINTSSTTASHAQTTSQPTTNSEPSASNVSAAPPIKTLSSGVRYVQAPQPDYPMAARRSGEEGRVILRILVNPQGLPEKVEIKTTSGYSRLDSAAQRAALAARFQPYSENGQALAVWVLVPIDFSLEN